MASPLWAKCLPAAPHHRGCNASQAGSSTPMRPGLAKSAWIPPCLALHQTNHSLHRTEYIAEPTTSQATAVKSVHLGSGHAAAAKSTQLPAAPDICSSALYRYLVSPWPSTGQPLGSSLSSIAPDYSINEALQCWQHRTALQAFQGCPLASQATGYRCHREPDLISLHSMVQAQPGHRGIRQLAAKYEQPLHTQLEIQVILWMLLISWHIGGTNRIIRRRRLISECLAQHIRRKVLGFRAHRLVKLQRRRFMHRMRSFVLQTAI